VKGEDREIIKGDYCSPDCVARDLKKASERWDAA
jgi:hypothetical protein